MSTKTKPAAKKPTTTLIDVRQAPQMIRIGADGKPLAEGATGHVAVLLPQYGLMFDIATPVLAESWAKAKAAAKKVRTLGFKNWVLPERQELLLIVDLSKRLPAIDTALFPNTPTHDWYWTATELASDSSFAWGVLFYLGYVYYSPRNGAGFVRAVRRVPASQ